MSLRERIESKRIRRATVPVLISDPSADAQILQGVVAALAGAQQEGREDEATVLAVELERAQAAVSAHWEDVELQALGAVEWNAAAHEYEGEEGLDWDRALPVLLAESCTDPDAQDAEWWAKQLARPEWSQGDIASLKVALLRLNVDAAPAYIPKG